MTRTKFVLILSVMMLFAMLATNALARQAPSNSAQAKAPDAPEVAKLGPVSNPVSGAVKVQLPRFSKNMVAAAEAMPAEKFNFKPTPEMNSFAHLVMHIAQSNNGLCSKISGTPAPEVAECLARMGFERQSSLRDRAYAALLKGALQQSL